MADLQLRFAEECSADPYLLWDTKWNAARGFADWAISGADEVANRGGLSAKSGIETDVIISLFTDRAAPVDHPLSYLADGEKRGWWGDEIDVLSDRGEGPIGSHLWLLRRAPLTVAGQPVSRWAEIFATEALAHLMTLGLATRIDVAAAVSEAANRLDLTVDIYGSDGIRIFDRKFDILWNQVAR